MSVHGVEAVAEDPVAELDSRYSSDSAVAAEWREGVGRLVEAGISWLATVRPDGRPHVTPLLSVWLDGALYFCTGATEQKARNLAGNRHCSLTTGDSALGEGLDVVVEGDAGVVRDDAKLHQVADLYQAHYGSDWHFDVRDGAFFHGGGEALVYEVVPAVAFGFRKGEFGQTRWRFGP